MSKSARDTALSLLARRAHTRRELKQKLLKKSFDVADIDAVLDALVESGYIDDAKTSAGFAAERARGGKGRTRIAAELAARGVSRTDAEAALAGLDPGDEAKSLLAALEKRRRTLPPGLTPAARSKKLFDHLVRRGFSPGAVLEAIRKKGDPT